MQRSSNCLMIFIPILQPHQAMGMNLAELLTELLEDKLKGGWMTVDFE